MVMYETLYNIVSIDWLWLKVIKVIDFQMVTILKMTNFTICSFS